MTYVAEIKKPDGERLPGYHESQLESLQIPFVLSGAHLPGHGNCAYDRCSGSWT